MKLLNYRLDELMNECLSKDGTGIEVDGVINKYVFDKSKLEHNKHIIKELLNNLPNEFKQSGGGGYSFLNACMDNEGNQWGEQINAEWLMCLGVACGEVSVMPRYLWMVLPGGMPYFTIINA